MVSNRKQERIHFRKEGVVVNYPGQARPVQVQRLPLDKLELMPTVKGGFEPFRLVINLKVADAAQPSKKVNVFSPPIQVRVRYTAEDLKKAQARGKPLSLGFWDGKQWVRCTSKLHHFHLEAKATRKYAGWGVVDISEWGDPTKAWGT